MELDLVLGQQVYWHGYDAIVRHIEGDSITIEMLNGEMQGDLIAVDSEELAEQNEDLVISQEDEDLIFNS